MRSALRKLVRALPEPFRVQAEAAAASVHVDAAGWGRADADLPRFLDPIQQAVIDGVQVELGYVDRGGRESTRTVHPLGVVSKGTAWYLVAGTDRGQRLFRIDRVTSAAPSEEPADRPADFDLAAEWRAIAEAIDHAPLEVRAVADADRIDLLRAILGSRLDVGGPGPDGVDIVVRGHSPRSVAGELAGAGSWVRIIEPEEVRVELARVARELTGLYGRPEPQS